MSLSAQLARRPFADILLATEAAFWLMLFRVCLAMVQVRTIVRAIRRGGANGDAGLAADSLGAAIPESVFRVRWAVEAVARNSPIAFVCFPQTLAGYTMLRLRGIQTTMVYGVARSPEGLLIAHTWLSVGERILLGGEGASGFNPIERWS